jgi:hypothetical protein
MGVKEYATYKTQLKEQKFLYRRLFKLASFIYHNKFKENTNFNVHTNNNSYLNNYKKMLNYTKYFSFRFKFFSYMKKKENRFLKRKHIFKENRNNFLRVFKYFYKNLKRSLRKATTIDYKKQTKY